MTETLDAVWWIPLLANLLLITFAIWAMSRYEKKQNHQKGLGGPISRPKVVWLGLCVYSWFLFPLLMVAFSKPHFILWNMVFFYALNMWIRGISELLMLYKWKVWKPPMGIGHDIVCFLQTLTFLIIGFGAADLTNTTNQIFVAYGVWVLISLCFEIKHAYSFFHAIKGKTTGEDGIWFADEDPKFRAILWWTRLGNWTLGLSLALLVVLFHFDALGFMPNAPGQLP